MSQAITKKAIEVIDNAERNGIIYVPSIVLLEILGRVDEQESILSRSMLWLRVLKTTQCMK